MDKCGDFVYTVQICKAVLQNARGFAHKNTKAQKDKTMKWFDKVVSIRMKAMSIHYLTATGGGVCYAGVAGGGGCKVGLDVFLAGCGGFFIDGLDGPLARRYDVQKNAGEYDGYLLDLIIDYLTYVFIPAYALFGSGLLNGWSGWVCIIVIAFTSALYFADTRMKTKDKSFAGFPGCWNMVVLVLFATKPPWQVILAMVIVLAVSQFTHLKFIHPVRTVRWRRVSLPVAICWTALAGVCAWADFQIGGVVLWVLAGV